MTPDFVERGQACRQQLVALIREQSRTQAVIAQLLIEVHDHSYWHGDFESFEAYCGTELDMALRTAQALMRTYRQCQKAGVSAERIEQIGWSKVALLANRLKPGNSEELLEEAREKTHAELKAKYRPSQSARRSAAKDETSPLFLTKPLQKALIRASILTGTDDVQRNLELIAESFLHGLGHAQGPANGRFDWN